MKTAKNQNHNLSFLPGVETPGYNYITPLGFLGGRHSGVQNNSCGTAGGDAAAARVRRPWAAGALLWLELLVILVQAKRTRKKKDI